MPRVRYTTKHQRGVLQSIGILHIKGRTFDEADSLITQGIHDGSLHADCRQEPATTPQLQLLYNIVVPTPPGLTKEQGKELIDREKTKRSKLIPATDKQLNFIDTLGGHPIKQLTKYEAEKYIDWLLDNQSQCPYCSAEVKRTAWRCGGCGRYLSKLDRLPPPFLLGKNTDIPPPIIRPPIPIPAESKTLFQQIRDLLK